MMRDRDATLAAIRKARAERERRPAWWRPFQRRRWDRAKALPADLRRQVAELVAERAAALGLVRAGDAMGAELALPGGRVISDRHAWRNVDASEPAIRAAAAEMVAAIAADPGPGRFWAFPGLEIVHLVNDDGVLVGLDDRKRPVVRLRALYFHERDAKHPAQPPQPCVGPEMDGCPFDAMAMPTEEQITDRGVRSRLVKYHCERCFAVYRANRAT